MRDLIIIILKLVGLILCTTVVAAGCGALLFFIYSLNKLAGYISVPVLVGCLAFIIVKIVE